MRKFLVKLLLMLLLFLVIDRLFFFIIDYSSKSQYDKRLENILNGKIQSEILVMGSSRAARNLIAEQISNATKKTCYNLGYPGSDIDFHNFLLDKAIRYNQKLKLVVLVLDDSEELLPSNSLKFRYDRLYPLANFKEINQELIIRGENSFLSKYIYSLRARISNFKTQDNPGPLDTISKCGSMPISFAKIGVKCIYNSKIEQYSIAEELNFKKAYFEEFINQCKKNEIQLLIVFPPNYYNPNRLFEKRILKLARDSKNENIYFCMYDNENKKYQDSSYYYDINHLKTNGAQIFTDEVADFINLAISSKLNQTHQGSN